MSADRCETMSGPYRCSERLGHAGECVTRATTKPWVGPACMPRDVARARSPAGALSDLGRAGERSASTNAPEGAHAPERGSR
jgi:hypothetical protein